jgi:hypothetical protein
MLPAEGAGVGGRGRARTLRRYGGLRLQAVPTAGGAEWFAVTQDETVNIGLFESQERATACFEAARGAAIARAATEDGEATGGAAPANVTELDAYRRRRRR